MRQVSAKRWRGLLTLAAAICVGSPLHAQARAEKTTVFTGVHLIHGGGAKPLADQAIVVTGERIVAIGTRDKLAIPQGAEIVDMKGRYALPGLINVHHHMNTPPKASYTEAMLRRELYGGVTTTRDPADDLRLLSEIARAARLGEIPSPEIHYAVMMAGPSFYADPRTQASSSGGYAGYVPWMQAITDKTDMKTAVAMARGTGATGIKIYANLPGHLVKAITEEAHRQGIKSWSHTMVFPATPEEAVDAGVDTISHVCDIGYQALDTRPTSYNGRNTIPLPPELFVKGDNQAVARLYEKMVKKGTILDATLYVYRPRPRPPGAAARPQSPSQPPMASRCPFEVVSALTLQAFRAGVPIAAGTDGFSPWQDPYLSLHTEMELLQSTGIPPLEVIKAATLNGARVVGRTDEIGTLEAGKLADILFVEKNPAEDVANLKSVVMVVKRGRTFPRSDYVPLTEEQARQRPMDSVTILPIPANLVPINAAR